MAIESSLAKSARRSEEKPDSSSTDSRSRKGNNQKSAQKFVRSGSLRTLKIVRNKSTTSSESRKSIAIKESKGTTFSSTLKVSKFPQHVEPQIEALPEAKLCRYQHCSLNGHHHHEPPLKRFEYLKRRSSKDQKSINPRSQATDKLDSKKKEAKVTKKNQGGDRKEPNPEKGKSSGWNYIKKVKLLKSFLTEFEKAKKLDPNKRRNGPLVPESESDILSLRHQAIVDKKNYDEWMIDHALQQVVGELAPTHKRKVSFLVKAFETVAPK